jgi:hypothetical protein
MYKNNMKQFIINFPQEHYAHFLELVQKANFPLEIKELEAENEEDDHEPTPEEILQNLKDAVKEVKLIKAGKMKGINARDLLKAL